MQKKKKVCTNWLIKYVSRIFLLICSACLDLSKYINRTQRASSSSSWPCAWFSCLQCQYSSRGNSWSWWGNCYSFFLSLHKIVLNYWIALMVTSLVLLLMVLFSLSVKWWSRLTIGLREWLKKKEMTYTEWRVSCQWIVLIRDMCFRLLLAHAIKLLLPIYSFFLKCLGKLRPTLKIKYYDLPSYSPHFPKYFQGVHSMLDGCPGKTWEPNEKRINKLVFIGRNLDETALKKGFKGCLV